MQPPPQAVPPGAGPPPPLATSRNMYWRSGPLGRRANPPAASAASGPVRPVTDPFAFGMQTPRASPLGSTAKGDPPAMQGLTPAALPPSTMSHPPQPPHAGDNSCGPNKSSPAQISQSGPSSMFSNAASTMSFPACATSRAEIPPGAEYGISNTPAGQSNALGAQENSAGGHQGWTSVTESWPSGQNLGRNPTHPSSTSSPSLSFHPPVPHVAPQWMGAQGNPLQPQGHLCSSYPEPPAQNASLTIPQTSMGVSQSGAPLDLRPSPPHQSPAEALSGARGGSGMAPLGHNMGSASPWSGQFPQEHFYLQPLEMTSTPLHPNAQEHNPPAQLQGRPTQAAGEQSQTGAEVGRISMFFKGDEAENEEILSSERSDGEGKADFDAFQSQTMGHTYYQPLHSHQVLGAGFSSAQPYVAFPMETRQKEADTQHSFGMACAQHGVQAAENAALAQEGQAGLSEAVCGGVLPYENVENQECIQNQEVLPSEPPGQSHPSPGTAPDSSRYASLPGPSLPKSSGAGGTERGPNLEAPDALLQPVRPDSVSSNYSNLSHRSLSGATRLGTFIQQESGKPEEEDALGGFFKQVDSSPLGGEASGQNPPSKGYYGSLSQAPLAPSPPKPTGVFQTSANSSFEPVRSHGLCLRPAESDHANMVVELREKPPNQRNVKESPTTLMASPGNLEQPPDNLETLLPLHAHPLPLPTESGPGAPLQLIGGSGAAENAPPLGSERRPSARVQGAVKKCESPATTLWAPNELPSFGASVLLAPAAPAVYVPAKASSGPVVQPPEEGWSVEQPPSKQGSVLPLQARNHSSENLENPPKMGEDETVLSQASSGYASLLSSPPTEALHNTPVLLAQANQSSCLTQPVNFSLAHQLHKNGHNHFAKDLAKSKQASEDCSHGLLFPAAQAGSTVHLPSAALSSANPSQIPLRQSEIMTNKPAHLPRQPASHGPLNLAPEKHTNAALEGGPPPEWVSKPGTNAGPPVNPRAMSSTIGLASGSNSCNPGRPENDATSQEFPKPLDNTVAKGAEQSSAESRPQHHNPLLSSSHLLAQPSGQVDPEAPWRPFCPQVTKDMQPPEPSGRATPLQHKPQVTLASQVVDPPLPSAPSNPQVSTGVNSAQAAGHRLYPAGPLDGSSAPPPASYGQGFSGQTPSVAPPVSLPSIPGQPPPPSEQQQQQQTPQNAFMVPPNPYCYYPRHPYEAYPSAYQPPYPPVDPRTAHLYYQEDVYGRYDPSYRQYGSAAVYGDPESYRYMEPERPSSRASHTSDRPPSRQGYPEDYYNTKGGWSNYYAESYANAYDYGDHYPAAYDPRYRDLRAYDQRYWYDTDQHSYPKRESYPYGNSQDRYEDHWRYDPRFAGSFEDDLEPRRDPYGDEFDRHSIHSEHSGHSLRSSRSIHSRQSSFSSRSQQSQLYQSNHDLTSAHYEGDPSASLLHADYPCGVNYPHYINPPSLADYNHSAQAAWSAMEQVPSRPLTPEKFSVPHVCARFGPGGSLIKVLPNLPSEGQPALVEIHSMEMIMQRSSEQEEMRAFPGPLTKEDTHKVDVINFAQNRAMRCSQDETLLDKESARLLWDFVVLLCRQNGTVVGTDIAELLLSDHKTVWLPGKSPNEANLIDFTNEALEQVEEESGEAQLSFLTDSLITTLDSLEKETERFRELLLYGRKKDALESAMKHGLWGHALLLASKMDSRTHARVMTRFANSLPINDPLQTVYQLMSGRMPAASTCCGDEKWGDWRPHLAMVLSNLTNNMEVETRSIVTMGDTLASKGLLEAAHFCYLMAQVGFGVYVKKTAKLVLLGSNHSLPFSKFATSEAIQRTEAYEYAQSLGTHPCALPNFQVFKFIYACRLAEMGLPAQAFHYCEVISKAILQNPHYVSPVLVGQVIQISSQLRLFDPQIKEKPEQEIFIEPNWLIQLRHFDQQIKEGSLAYSAGRSTPQHYACSTPSSEVDRSSQNEGTGRGQDMSSGPDNPLLASLLPGPTHSMQGVQLMPSAPQTILEATAASSQQEVLGAVPFYPVGPSTLGPGSSFLGPFVAGETPAWSGMGLLPEGPPQPHDLHQEPVEREAAVPGASAETQAWKPSLESRDEDFYTKMASMGSGRRSRSTSQSSAHMGYGQRSRTTSESSVHSVGRERPNSAAKQPSPPPPSIPEGKETKRETKKEPAPRKSSASWFGWLRGKSKNEAHLPDDKNKSIVWDEKKQRWVNLDEPEENKPLPPPPIGFPQVPQVVPRSPANSSVNMFSRKAAASKAQYVDFLKPSRTPSSGVAPAPSDLFATLAPMPIPANLFVPSSDEQQISAGHGAEEEAAPRSEVGPEMAAERPYLNSVAFPPGPDLPSPHPEGSHSGELSRSSSMSSLSREVSQHFNQPPLEGPPTGTVQFYNPSQFAQSAARPGSSRSSRIGQRQYPTLK